jgi:formylmethanofuran dehydrogenase subunit D
VSGTCAWILEHKIFREWKANPDDSLIWLSAGPGCGKSVLSRALIDEKLVGTEQHALCHFFFKENEEQNNALTAMCALLHQLFWAHKDDADFLRRQIDSAIRKCGPGLKNDFEELWQVFISAATDPSAKDIICVVDALDECRKSDRDKLIACLERFYGRPSNEADRGSKLKFFVTSRPYPEIELKFSNLTRGFPTIRLADDNESGKITREIGLVIDARVKEIGERRGLRDDVQLALQMRLCEIPNRTYLWLHLALDQVENGMGKTEKRLLKLIETIPTTVDDAYEKLLTRCEQKETKRVLHIIVAAQRPLTLGEIDVALEIDAALENDENPTSYQDLDLCGQEDRKQWIRECCGLFVSVVDSRVYLIHQTAREFLVRKNSERSGLQGWKSSISLQEAHRVLSNTCVTYLLFSELQKCHLRIPNILDMRRRDVSEYLKKHAFFDYSATHWISHVKVARHNSSFWISKTAKLCDIGDGQDCVWFRVYYHMVSSSLWYLMPERNESTLYWAIKFGLINETQFLLDSGVDIGNAFLEAARNENHGKELVALFLDRRGDELKITEKVVQIAAGNPRSGQEVLALLLEQRGDEVEITEEIVKVAARAVNPAALELLLKQRRDKVKITEEIVKTAARAPASATLELLLKQRGDEVKITEEVVKAAAGAVNPAALGLLLEQRGDEVKITEEIVKAAAGAYSPAALELLLKQRGDEVKITEETVKAAARAYSPAALELLLKQRGDEVKITEEIVKAAARAVYPVALGLLFKQRGDEVKITEEIVKAAARAVNPATLGLLLEQRGDEVEITEEIVKAAAGAFTPATLELLLEKRGDEVKITDDIFKAAAGNRSVIALLLKHRRDAYPTTEYMGLTEMAYGGSRSMKRRRC